KDIEVNQDREGIKSTYGTLLPIKFRSLEERQMVFVYPKSKLAPDARKVKESFLMTNNGFSSLLGKVEGTIYIGEKIAGGFGDSLDINQDGKPEITLDSPCGFIVQLTDGKITKVETDTAVTVSLNGERVHLNAYEPMNLW